MDQFTNPAVGVQHNGGLKMRSLRCREAGIQAPYGLVPYEAKVGELNQTMAEGHQTPPDLARLSFDVSHRNFLTNATSTLGPWLFRRARRLS
jgi:hypothetical protein